METAIIGAGIGGLTLALELHEAGMPCRVYEAVPQLEPVGVGINILPHASQVLCQLGLEQALEAHAVTTKESVWFNRFGQLIHREPAGRYGGFEHPQFSIHRGDLHQVLVEAVRGRLGDDAVVLDHTCTGFDQDDGGVQVSCRSTTTGEPLPERRADIMVACDGIHSVVRKQLHPDEGEPLYSGVNMWRGVTTHAPFLSGASMVRAGWLDTGKLVAYPIRDDIDGQGRQLVNWVVEVETPHHVARDWNRRGSLDDFIGLFEDWRFDWLDVPRLLRESEDVLEYPMVDQDPLDWWGVGRVTLLGDAAHPMVPRGSNGAGQAVLDARALRESLVAADNPAAALQDYEDRRRELTARIVRTNRTTPPDVILKQVWERTGDQPFDRIDDVISASERDGILRRYQEVAGYSPEALQESALPQPARPTGGAR